MTTDDYFIGAQGRRIGRYGLLSQNFWWCHYGSKDLSMLTDADGQISATQLLVLLLAQLIPTTVEIREKSVVMCSFETVRKAPKQLPYFYSVLSAKIFAIISELSRLFNCDHKNISLNRFLEVLKGYAHN